MTDSDPTTTPQWGPPRVSIIMPVWNRADLTRLSLESHWQLLAVRTDVEMIVVDNGSTDPMPDLLKQWKGVYQDKLTIVTHATNLGFAVGHNAGYAIAKGEVLIFISNDVIVHSGNYIAKIEARLARADKPILVGAEMHTQNTGWNVFRGVMHSDGRKRWDDAEPIPYLAGHLIATMRSTWDRLGGWDERYSPADYEDLDLSYNAIMQQIGLVAIALPVEHLFGQSASQLPGGRQQHTLKNRLLFMRKWDLGLSEGR